MTKREIINEIMEINLSAGAEFLSRFSDKQLNEYLQHLQVLQEPRMIYGDDSQGQGVAVCGAQATSVCTQERELGRWDEYLDRTDGKSRNAEDELDVLPESEETIDCVAGQDEECEQAWLF